MRRVAFVVLICFSLEAFAGEAGDPKRAFNLKFDEDRKRNFIWPPLVSLVLPGFDQWWERKWLSAGLYTGISLGTASVALQLNDHKIDFLSNRDNERLRAYFAVTSAGTGAMSSYHSFRMAVRSRQQHGEFEFLKHEEDPVDLLLAPFQVSYLGRPTTYWHLLTAVALGSIFVVAGKEEYKSFTLGDGMFAVLFSHQAGVWEEAFFRGYLMPLGMHWTGSPFWSNMLTALLFGAAHFATVGVPISQTIGGFYFGWLVQHNEWKLGEAIFNHAWWNLIIFSLAYAFDDDDNAFPSTVMLPLSFRF